MRLCVCACVCVCVCVCVCGTYILCSRKGKGTQIEPDGSKYEGEYADDRRHGQGKWTGPEGQIYDGNWHSDKVSYCHFLKDQCPYKSVRMCFEMVISVSFSQRFGRGTFEDTDGTSYHGEWVNNRKQGKGAFTWANGSKYSGGWENDKVYMLRCFKPSLIRVLAPRAWSFCYHKRESEIRWRVDE